MERRIDDQRPSAPLEWEAKHAAMDRAGELPLERRVAERRKEPPALVTVMASTIVALKEQVSGLQAARMAYASEFPLNADGEPDVGSIHANIRALKEQLAAAYEQAAKACENERVEDTGTEGDLGYNMAISHAAAAIRALASQPAAPVQPEMQEDLLDIVRTLVCAVDRQAERGENYPSPTSENSPIMLAARRACVERGYTDGGLAVEGVTYPATPPVQQPGDVRDESGSAVNDPSDDTHVAWSRPILYTDTIEGRQVCRDDLWAIATDELKLLTDFIREALAIPRPSAALTDEQEAALRDAMAEQLSDLYHCGRVWSAWGVGTMSEDDFSIASEDEDIVENFVSAAKSILAASSGAVAVPEWISVDNELPDVETDVLVFGKRGDSMCHAVAGLFNGEWLAQDSECELRFIVSHWCELPAAPATPAQGQTK